jgi:hypothetical protein
MACKNSRWKAANQSKDWRIRIRRRYFVVLQYNKSVDVTVPRLMHLPECAKQPTWIAHIPWQDGHVPDGGLLLSKERLLVVSIYENWKLREKKSTEA